MTYFPREEAHGAHGSRKMDFPKEEHSPGISVCFTKQGNPYSHTWRMTQARIPSFH